MGETTAFLVNKRLQAIDRQALLKTKFNFREAFLEAKNAIVGRDLALVPPGQFVPGTHYPSAQDGKPEWHLPHYVLRRNQGDHTTRLTLHPTDSNPDSPVGQLAIELQAIPASADHPTSRVLKHETTLRLGFKIPLGSDAESPLVAPRTDSDDVAGHWENLDADTTGVVELEIHRVAHDQLKISALENCPPKRCRMGGAIAQFKDGRAMVMFRSKTRTVALNIERRGEQLVVAEHIDIHDPRSPGDTLTEHIFVAKSSDEDLPIIWMELEDPQQISATVLRSVTQIQSREDYARILSVMTDPMHAARLELSCSASVGQRTLRQVFVGADKPHEFIAATGKDMFVFEKKEASDLRNLIASAAVNQPSRLNSIQPHIELRKPTRQPAPPTPAPPPAPPRGHRAALDPAKLVSILRTNTAGMTNDFRPNARMKLTENPRKSRRRRRAKAMHSRKAKTEAASQIRSAREVALRANAAKIEPSRTSVGSARAIKFDQIARDSLVDRKVPHKVLVDQGGEPVLTSRKDDVNQIVAPFVFDPERHAGVFDMPEDNPTGLVLLPNEVVAGDRRTVFYREGVESSRYYFEPEEFRLARDDTAPFAPSILFHLSEVVDAEATDNAEFEFEVSLAYRAVPYINPALIAAATAAFGPDATFEPIAPTIRSLTLSLPSEDGSAPLVMREDAVVDFSDGITDSVSLTEAQYQRFTRALQTASGIGLDGHVEVVLLDGTEATVPVRIGLRDNAEFAFDHAVVSSSADVAEVSLRNRIESPVRIDHLHTVALTEDGQASPAQLPSGQPVEPGQTTNLSYTINPPGTAVAALAPRIDASVLPDVLAILSQTTITQGYSDRDFTITVSIDPAFFDQSGEGSEALSAIEIQFRTREEPVVLTPDAPQQQVTLPMPLLLFMTNAREAQHYSYAVTDILGNERGQSAPYTAGNGNLQVFPVASANDFGGGFG